MLKPRLANFKSLYIISSVIKARINNIDKAAEFFLKKVHCLELSGDIQKAVIEYRRIRQKMNEEVDNNTEGELAVIEDTEELFLRYHEMLSDLYREDLEHWINQNTIINFELKEH